VNVEFIVCMLPANFMVQFSRDMLLRGKSGLRGEE